MQLPADDSPAPECSVQKGMRSGQSIVDWVKERINRGFAHYLEALSKGETAELAGLRRAFRRDAQDVALDAPRAEDF